jgi:uncharacterized lipoprotein NlpE involved in copper resistance
VELIAAHRWRPVAPLVGFTCLGCGRKSEGKGNIISHERYLGKDCMVKPSE